MTFGGNTTGTILTFYLALPVFLLAATLSTYTGQKTAATVIAAVVSQQMAAAHGSHFL